MVTLKDRTASNNGTTQTRYLHKDHLGSTTVITDEIATQVEDFSFDAWGKRRAPNLAKIISELGAWNTLSDVQKANLTISANTLASAVTNKGFTGHEQMDNVGLIHMNGRVYDADIGRFISADPFIQDRTNLQALNRYSYVQNNPLSYTDPSGYFLKKAFKKLKKAVKSVAKAVFKAHSVALKALVVRPLKSVLKAINKVPGLRQAISAALYAVPGCGAWCSVGFNAAITAANGGSLTDITTAAALAYVAAQYTPPPVANPGGNTSMIILNQVEEKAVGAVAGEAVKQTLTEKVAYSVSNAALDNVTKGGVGKAEKSSAQKDTTENWFAAGDHEYNRLSPAVCAASSEGCTQSAVVNALNTNGVHPNQSKPFVSGKPYVGDVDIPGPFGKDHVTSTSIFDSNGNQIGVRNVTLPDHALHPGFVERSVVNINGSFHVKTYGGGTGSLGGPNIWLDDIVWGPVDNNVIQQFK